MQGMHLIHAIPVLFALVLFALAGPVSAGPGDDTAAEAELKAFSSIDNASLAVYEGQNALQAGRYEEAAAAFTEAARADPSWMAAWYLKAYSLFRLNRTEEALAAVDRALSLDPADRDANTLKADILDSLGRKEEAERYRAVVPVSSPATEPSLPEPPATKTPLSPCPGISAVLVTAYLLAGRKTGL